MYPKDDKNVNGYNPITNDDTNYIYILTLNNTIYSIRDNFSDTIITFDDYIKNYINENNIIQYKALITYNDIPIRIFKMPKNINLCDFNDTSGANFNKTSKYRIKFKNFNEYSKVLEKAKRLLYFQMSNQ